MKKLLFMALAMLLFPLLTKAQFTLSGTVSDAKQPLSGASVKLKSAQRGATANRSGEYQFKNLQPGNYTLVVSYIGYETQEKTVNLTSNLTLDVVLAPSAFLADEVIVRGTQGHREIGHHLQEPEQGRNQRKQLWTRPALSLK